MKKLFIICKFILLLAACLGTEHILIEAGKPTFRELEFYMLCLIIIARSHPIQWWRDFKN